MFIFYQWSNILQCILKYTKLEVHFDYFNKCLWFIGKFTIIMFHATQTMVGMLNPLSWK